MPVAHSLRLRFDESNHSCYRRVRTERPRYRRNPQTWLTIRDWRTS